MTDPFQLASFQTGLVYSCSIDTGDCEGVRGDTSFYVGMDTSKFITNGIVNMATRKSDLFSRPFAEGRLFDQARKLNCITFFLAIISTLMMYVIYFFSGFLCIYII